MNHGPQSTSPAQPQHSRSVNHDRDSAHCSLTPAIVPAILHALQSPRAPADPALLQRCSCRGSSCCVMINEAMKHAPHLTVPRVHSVYTYRVSTDTHRAQPSPAHPAEQYPAVHSVDTGDTTLSLITAAVLNTHVVVTCFR